jgi:hypothetical protein
MSLSLDRVETASKREPPLSEPVIVPDLFVSGVHVTPEPSCVRFVGWATTGDAEGEIPERQIVVRFSMSEAASRKLRRDLSSAYAEQH